MVSRALQRNALLIQHCYSPYGTTQLEKTTKNRQKGPVWAPKRHFWGPRSYSEGLGLPVLVLTATGWSDSWSPHILNWYRASAGPPGAQNGPFGPKCPFWGSLWCSECPGGPDLVPNVPGYFIVLHGISLHCMV